MKFPFLRVFLLAIIGALLAAAPMQGGFAKQAKPAAAPIKTGSLSYLACANGGREAKLTASRLRKGERHYLEFRTRSYPGTPSGHMYVVFGELDAGGKAISRYHIGLAPDGLAIGFLGGALVKVPAHVTPRYMECSGGVIDAWRISVSSSQYAAVARKARASLLKPPLWSMFGFNCNHFAAGFGDIIGLKRPQDRNLTAALYLPAYVKANAR